MNKMRQLKQIRHLFGIILTMGAALSAASCAQEDDVIQDGQSFAEANKVTFGILKNDTWDDPDVIDTQTKGTSITASSLRSFNVLANITGSDKETLFFFKQGYTKSGSNWTAPNIYYWPGAKWTMDFYATNADIANMGNDAKITHTVNNSMSDQEDIVVAKRQNVEGDYNQVVGLSFNHILTAVSFKIGKIPYGNITAIEFNNVYISGEYDINGTEGQRWTPTGDTGGCQFKPSGTGVYGKKEGDNPLGTGESFFMIPQELGSKAIAVIEFADTTKERYSKTISLLGQRWNEGESITYTIDISSTDAK
jgi:hypothetical protein